jgi:hypothetical protein
MRFADVLLAVLVGLAALAWLNHVNPDPPVTHDSTRDLLLTRDCVELQQCHVVGAAASVPGIYQGAAWLDLLTVVQLFGGDTLAARAVIIALLSLGVATLFLVTWRWLRPSMALPAAILATSVLSLGGVPALLINPSAVFFPDAMCACALLVFASTGRRRYLVFAAFMLSLAIDTHVGALSLVPSVLAMACLARPRPLLSLLLGASVFLGTHLIVSRAAFVANLLELMDRGRIRLAGGGLLALVLAATLLNGWFRRRSQPARALLTGLILLGPFCAGTLWLVRSQGHEFNVTYWHPIIAPGAVLLAALIALPFDWPTRRLHPAWRGAALAVPILLSSTAILAVEKHYNKLFYYETATWTYDDARRVAKQLEGKGWSYEQMLTRVQGSFCLDLVDGMGVYTAAPTGSTVSPRRQVRVWRVPSAQVPSLPPGLDLVPLRNGRTALLSEITSWLDPDQVRACRQPLGGETPTCMPASSGADERVEAVSFLFSERSFPHVCSIETPSPYVATYEMRVLPTPGESRDIEVFDEGAPPSCGWEIARVEGIDVESRFSPRHVRVHSANGKAGTIVVQKSFGGPRCPAPENRNYTTCVLETTPSEEALRVLNAGVR